MEGMKDLIGRYKHLNCWSFLTRIFERPIQAVVLGDVTIFEHHTSFSTVVVFLDLMLQAFFIGLSLFCPQ